MCIYIQKGDTIYLPSLFCRTVVQSYVWNWWQNPHWIMEWRFWLQACRPWVCRVCPPRFWQISYNPISTRGNRLCPPNYYWHTRIFRPSDSPGWIYDIALSRNFQLPFSFLTMYFSVANSNFVHVDDGHKQQLIVLCHFPPGVSSVVERSSVVNFLLEFWIRTTFKQILYFL